MTQPQDVKPIAQDKPDGRLLRSERSRQLIITAIIELIDEGHLIPTAQQVAHRADVGIRSVFRHFDDMDSICKSSLDIETGSWQGDEMNRTGGEDGTIGTIGFFNVCLLYTSDAADE